MRSDRVVLWDFDGTLAHRPGRWSRCLIDALDDESKGHGVSIEDVRPFLRDGFPWHRPDEPHEQLAEPNAWWAPVEALMARAYAGVGIEPERAVVLARRARDVYVDHTRAWLLFDDTVPVLTELRESGWRHVILSNHVPELPALVDGLGLGNLVDVTLTSASFGYEKPNPQAFAHARQACGDPDELWMVGDNPVADIDGATRAGIPAVLVRHDGAPGLEAVISALR